MKQTLIILVFAIALFSCSPRILPPSQDMIRDTLIKEHIVTFKDTTIMWSTPEESHSNVILPTDTSRLSTSLATSSAWVDTSGRLHHTLNNIPQLVPVHISIPTHVYSTEKASLHKIIQYVEVERKLKWWQEGQMWAGRIALIFLALWLVWKIWGGKFATIIKAATKIT